jgi:hypothetical protein
MFETTLRWSPCDGSKMNETKANINLYYRYSDIQLWQSWTPFLHLAM